MAVFAESQVAEADNVRFNRIVHRSSFLKSVVLPALLLGVANAPPPQAAPEGPPGGPQAHVEGDEANTVPDDRVIRLVHFDLCWPGTNEEYVALGKHAILMITATSRFANELPLTAAYVQTDDSSLPLQRIVQFDAAPAKGRTSQVSFYLLPINLTKQDARLLVDFTGQRKAFSVTSFSKAKGLDPRLPAFLHMDQHDSPGRPDMEAVRAMLVREYPDYFPGGSANLDARAPSP